MPVPVLSVSNVAASLAAEARCVEVSAMRCVKKYSVLGVKPLNVGEVCQLPPFILYSQPSTSLSMMLVAVFDANVGAAGAACVILLMTSVNSFVASPTVLLAFTVILKLPPTVGVPEIKPPSERLNPVGKLPPAILHVMGAVPVAVSCRL